MTNILKNKIDFALIMSVKNANPNGDPLNGNRPRVNFDGLGEISDVAIKRKIRNRLLDLGEKVLMQSHDYKNDNHENIKARVESVDSIKKETTKKGTKDADKVLELACKEWIDVRTFGQVLAFGKEDDDSKGLSVPIRGPLSIQPAFSIEPVDLTHTKIVKSMNSTQVGGVQKDRMGDKHRIDHGIYVTYGTINPQLAQKTGFTKDDALKIKEAMRTLFENDATSARPSGSMEVLKLIWWEQDKGNNKEILSSARVHRSLTVNNDGTCQLDGSIGISAEVIDGM